MVQPPSSPSPPFPFPRFERPSEAVVYWTLANLCKEQGGQCAISLRALTKCTRLSVNTVNRAVAGLAARGILRYRPGPNQFCPTTYTLSTERGAKLSPEANAVAKNGVAIPSDSDHSTKNLSIGDNHDIGKFIHTQHEDSTSNQVERLASFIADGLEDTKNLALYKSYCSRFPVQVILKAYLKAKEVSPERIKKSRGALFNYLVQRYAKKQTSDNDSGHQAG